MTQVTAEGTFEVEVSAKQVALTITNPREWVYLPKIDADGRQLSILLSSDCTPLRGEVHLSGTIPPKVDPIRIPRVDDQVGDLFGASLDGKLRFEACLPRAQYQIMLPSQFANRIIVADVPSQAVLSIDAVTQQYATTPPSAPLAVEFTSRDGFVDQLPSAVRLLGLGESNHGTGEFTHERASLLMALARERAFSMVLLEAGFGEVLPINAYIRGEPVDLDSALSRIGVWIWRTREFREALEAFRVYNQKVVPDRQISIMGIDVQRSAGALEDLLGMHVGLTQEETRLLSRLRDRDGSDWKNFSESERLVTVRTLERIADKRDQGGVAVEVNRHALCARSLRLLLDLVDARTFWDRNRMRNHAMAQLALAILDLEPELRGTLWAHLAHVARQHRVGVQPLGGYLSSALGERYRSYGLLAYEGAARARDLQRLKESAIAHRLATAPAYSLEGVLASSARGGLSSISYWSFGDRTARQPHWLDEMHWLRAFGDTYPGDARSYDLYNLGAIDGAVLFKTVTPSRPLNPPRPPPATNPSH